MHIYLKNRCPICGHEVMATSHGYKCEGCGLLIPQYIANRYITLSEAEDILAQKSVILDGFSNADNTIFSAIPIIRNGKVETEKRISACPFGQHGLIAVGTHKFYCTAHSYCIINCHFMLRRSYNGYRLTVDDVLNLLHNGQISFVGFDKNDELKEQIIVKSKFKFKPELKAVL